MNESIMANVLIWLASQTALECYGDLYVLTMLLFIRSINIHRIYWRVKLIVYIYQIFVSLDY